MTLDNGDSGREELIVIGQLTLRDFFAAAALVGMTTTDEGFIDREIAESAYLIADAMLRERTQS